MNEIIENNSLITTYEVFKQKYMNNRLEMLGLKEK